MRIDLACIWNDSYIALVIFHSCMIDVIAVKRRWHEQATHIPQAVPVPGSNIHILANKTPELDFYRFLYRKVGESHGWYERLHLSDEQLAQTLHHPQNELKVLFSDGNPIGFAELDLRNQPDGTAHLAHFGIFPEYRGRKFGKYFFNWTLHQVWSQPIQRVHMHTYDWDHPAALKLSAWAGFSVTKEEIVRRPVPAGFSVPPNGQA